MADRGALAYGLTGAAMGLLVGAFRTRRLSRWCGWWVGAAGERWGAEGTTGSGLDSHDTRLSRKEWAYKMRKARERTHKRKDHEFVLKLANFHVFRF